MNGCFIKMNGILFLCSLFGFLELNLDIFISASIGGYALTKQKSIASLF